VAIAAKADVVIVRMVMIKKQIRSGKNNPVYFLYTPSLPISVLFSIYYARIIKNHYICVSLNK